ncbi:MAG: beta-lactamase family protein, partial [Lachnospiraceae bacterium]|nr:beta-lactamase family protein [Lachnospiraceae bacterium]
MEKEKSIFEGDTRMNFDAFIKDIQNNQWNVHGVEIYEDGRLTHQYGDTADTRFPIYSATKTITSIAAGMAWDQGKIDLEQPLLTYLPPEIISQMPEEQNAVFREITIRRLLTMSVDNFPFRPEGESYLKFSL